MPKSADEISPWKLQHIIEEKEWGDSNSTVADFHNHDAAAGLMSGRATGSYAYDALILKKPDLHYHAVGKIKVMESIISLLCEGRTLDLLQTHFLQTGTFEHDSSIHWYLDQLEANRGVLEFKKSINHILDIPAFWPVNVSNRKVINIDEKSKSLTVVRSSKEEDYVVFINIASFMQFDFKIPVPKKGKYELILNSDMQKFAGSGRTNFNNVFNSEQVNQFEYFNYGLNITTVPPYAIFIWKKIT
jgi:1,4-alpha-glucan branching enzyme